MNKKAFTLVELIVVITILAVLGTIAFVSFQDYVLNSRDSKRTTDIKNIEKALELSKLQTGVYPMPGNASAITFSGATAWEQGEFNNDVTRVVRNFKEAPKDPLVDTFYGYSVTKNRGEYQLGAVLEESDYGTSVNGKLAAAYVKGNYNGKTVKVSTGSMTYILGAPSILTSDLNETDLIDIINAKKLVYKGHQNLPASYTGTTYDLNGGFDFSPATIVAYEGDLASVDSNTLVDNLQQIYTGTVISEEPDIEVIFSEDTDLTTDIILNKRPGTTASSGGSGGGSSNNSYNPIAPSCMEMTQQHVDNLNNALAEAMEYGPVGLLKDEWCALRRLETVDSVSVNIPDEIANIPTLQTLQIRNVGNMSDYVWGMQNLRYLYLNEDSVIKPYTLPNTVASLINLEELTLGFDITNISNLGSISNLRQLSLKTNQMINLSDLNGLSTLEDLSLSGNLSVNFVGVNLPVLNRLSTNNTNINNLTGIDNLTSLTSLSINYANLSDISALSGLNNLSSIFLRGSNVSDITPISTLRNLRTIYIQANNITNISSLDLLGTHPGGSTRSFHLDCSEITTPATKDGDFYRSIGRYVYCYTDGSNTRTSVRSYSTPIFQ